MSNKNNNNFVFSLPVWQERERIMKVLFKKQRVVIKSETGTGKSIVLPILLATLFPNERIFVVEPRRIAAKSLAQTLQTLGFDAGYQIRFEADPGNRILFLTDGIAIKKLKNVHNLILILDEFHERRVTYDLLFAMFKDTAKRIVITSATIDIGELEDFIQIDLNTPKRFPVEKKIINEREDERDYIEIVVDEIIANWRSARRMLVFLPGINEITHVESAIMKKATELNLFATHPKTIVRAHSSAGSHNFEEVIFSDVPAIILATNIAETSITPNNLDLVISSGVHRIMIYENGIEHLVTTPVPKSSFQQQGGRVGRTKPGKHVIVNHEKHPEYLPPEIVRTNPDSLALTLSYYSLNPKELDWLTEPNWEELEKSYLFLFKIGAIDKEKKVTEKGKFMFHAGIDPKFAHIIHEVKEKHPHLLTLSLALIAALTEGDRIFVRPKDHEFEADEARKSFFLFNSDWATLLNILKRALTVVWFNGWDSLKDWAFSNFIRYSAIRDMIREFHRLTSKFDVEKKIPEIMKEEIDSIAIIAQEVFIVSSRYYKWEYVSKAPKEDDAIYGTYIHPSSALFGSRQEKVLSISIRETTKKWLQVSHPLR